MKKQLREILQEVAPHGDLWGVPATADPERLRELKPPLSRVNGEPLEEFLKEAP